VAYIKIDWDWLRCELHGLSGTATRVLLVLLSFRNRKTGECYPSMVKIARILDVSEDTVERAISELDSQQWIQRDRARTNRYTFHPDLLSTQPANLREAKLPTYRKSAGFNTRKSAG